MKTKRRFPATHLAAIRDDKMLRIRAGTGPRVRARFIQFHRWSGRVLVLA